MAAVFLGQKCFLMGAVARRVELEGVIGASSDKKLTFIVEVKGRDISVGFREFE